MNENDFSYCGQFEQLRPTLLGTAYRMLGTFSEAEDIVQEAFLRFQEVDPSAVESNEAYLRTIVVRLCLDELKSSRAKREMYTGIWLPEPVNTATDPDLASDPVEHLRLQEALSSALLLVLEVLSPDERAVFLLRTVFEYDYDEIARMVSKSEAACRKLLSRAKIHMDAHRPIFSETCQERHENLAGFLAAVETGDMDALIVLLTEE